jgi:hypothetical protein
MTDDWWPTPLAHMADEDPWALDDVVVAELKSFDEKPHAGHRRLFAALVPIDQIKAVKATLANLDHNVSTSGPHPFYMKNRPFRPEFWVGAKELPSEKYEPLVLSWTSHDKTVLQPEPGFLMTYGLIPRSVEGGRVYWDDPRAPRHDIVTVTAPSVWDFPLGTHAYVSISKDYLQDYLTLRHMALVQIFWEIRWGPVDAEIEKRLNGEEGVNIDFPDRRLQIGRAMGDHSSVFTQVWGARLLAMPGALPITAETVDDVALVWPGINKPVTNAVAQGLRVTDYVCVNDSVLSAYEGRPGFSIIPESGAVSFGTQWSVGFCDRVGRNLIRLEAKKLYEGAPAAVVRYWHNFAVVPLPDSAFPAALGEPNIATRARAITYALVDLGEALSSLAQSLGIAISPEEFVGLRGAALDYSGWWTSEIAEPVSRNAPLSMPADAFLDRCMSLGKLLIESLSEAKLRVLLQAIGVPAKDIKELGTLKLLDRIVCLAQLAAATGLTLADDGVLLWERLSKEGTNPAQPISHLFALYDVRILQAHKANDRNQKLQVELKRFGIKPGQENPGYGRILDQVYDSLSAELAEIATKIESAAYPVIIR